tara:strand:+ start:1098 stop:1985 length:888 start_codon:yes stop_codon:yes gene_type:complete
MPIETSMNENFFAQVDELPVDTEQCVVNDFGGKSHSYGLCVTPPVGLKDCNDNEGMNFNFNCMGKNFGEMTAYMDCLLIDDKQCLAHNKRYYNECAPLSGNTYALKTNSKCIDHITGNEQTLYKFINNQSGCENIITGRSGADAGAMMKALTKAGCVVDGGLFNSFMGETKPKCMRVKAKCSISAPEGGNYELKSTGPIYLEIEQANALHKAGMVVYINDEDTIINEPENFTNLYEDIYNYYKKNPDIGLNHNIEHEIDNIYNNNNNNNNNINNVFNGIILLLLLYVLFKILYKK